MTQGREPAGSKSGSIEARLAAAGLPPLPRLAWLDVDLAVLEANARLLGRALPAGTALGVVVKADGYGHGMEASARAALRGGASVLAVATLDEALALRIAGIDARVLVLYPVPAFRLADAIAADLDLVVADDASVAAMTAHLRGRASIKAPRVHLGFDTGMARGGVAPGRAVAVARALADAGLARLAGTWSHLAAPEDPAFVAAQVARFEGVVSALAGAGIDPGERHLDSTGGLVGGLGPAYDLVRVGLAAYGVLPPELLVEPAFEAVAARLRPALRLRARATMITAIPPGASVGYGGTWTAARPSLVATLPVGYADGWARAYAAGWGVTRGVRVPLVGRVSSDAIALDVTDVPGFGPAHEVELIGEPPAMTVHDLASLRGSIAWEVLDAFTPRLPRVYTEDGRPVGIRYLDGATRFVPTSAR